MTEIYKALCNAYMKNIQHPNTDHLAKTHKDTLSDGKAPTACSHHTRANILACVYICFNQQNIIELYSTSLI